MKLNSAVLAAVLATAVAHGASPDGDSNPSPYQVYPKNLARQHLGANLLTFDSKTQTFTATEAAAAWLDDDIATGWPAATGHHYYALALPEPQLLTNFSISEHASSGTVNLYASDELSVPRSKSWTLIEKNVNVDDLNQKVESKSFSRFAKYFLIETNLSAPGQWYSVYLYGEKPAVAYHLQRRAQPVDPKNVFGPYSNSQTAFSMSSLYAHSHVSFANTAESSVAWQKAIDDNPETGTRIAPSHDEAGMIIRYDNPHSIQRISVLTDGKTKGKLEFFVTDSAVATKPRTTDTASNESNYIQASNVSSNSLTTQKPVASITFDGSNPRGSADFTPASGTQLVARWTPETAGQDVAVQEVNSFGNEIALNDHEIAPDLVGEQLGTDSSKDGKEARSFKDPKEALSPVAENAPLKTPFIPGPPPNPPNVPFHRNHVPVSP